MKTYDQFETYEWLGLFMVPDSDIEFPGRLSYSPEDGVQLEFMCSFDVKMQPVNHLYGALYTGEVCTVFGDFDINKSGEHWGRVAIKKGRLRFNAVIFGVGLDEKLEFDGLWVDFTNFQEFCHPQGFKHYASHKREPLFSFKKDGISIELGTSAEHRDFGSDIDSILITDNQNAKSILRDAFERVHSDYPGEVTLISDISWNISITSEEKISIGEVLRHVSRMEYLLSILIYHPVRVKSLSIKVRNEKMKGYFDRKSALLSFFDMSNHKIKVLNKAIVHQFLQITPNTVNLPMVLDKWDDCFKDYLLFIPRISNKFGKYHEHELMGDIVISMTQIENIYNENKTGNYDKRYEEVIDRVDCGTLKGCLYNILHKGKKGNLGKMLSDFRAIAAHSPIPNKKPISYDGNTIMWLSRCLEVAIISHIYGRLGIPRDVIAEFQKTSLLPQSRIGYNASTSTDTTVSANEPKAG